MSSTNGTKPLPLPASVKDGLRAINFIPYLNVTKKGDPQEAGQPCIWRHAKHGTGVVLAASNIPGESGVVLASSTDAGIPTGRHQIDVLLATLAAFIVRVEHPNQVRRA